MGEELEQIVGAGNNNSLVDMQVDRRGFLAALLGLTVAATETSCSPLVPVIERLPIAGLNLAEVDNFFYRSAQVNEDDLRYLKTKYSIETVLILRGEHPEEPWYNKEIKACEKLGITAQAFSFSSKYPSKPDVYIAYITALEQNKHTVKLVHCRSGAERSSLASAFYVLATGGNLSDAKHELDSIHSFVSKYSYMRRLINDIWQFVNGREDRTTAMKEFFSSQEYLRFYEALNPDAKNEKLATSGK
ncbi:TPA: dual specificity protein phosphatase family protein [Candidatus Woesearchaeota archaeon]|nr:dual specificity protein phosphatase family protein [Candidatus Woesearchaeota archaeon]